MELLNFWRKIREGIKGANEKRIIAEILSRQLKREHFIVCWNVGNVMKNFIIEKKLPF